MARAPVELSREQSHPRAREVLADAFFWDASDPTGPFGDETGQEVLEAFRAFRDEEPRGDPLALLGELLETWEVADGSWDVVDSGEVQALGADDELGLLVRDEAIVALAFAQIVVEGRVDPEVRRRALLALVRQGLPALIHGWGDRAHTRSERVERMRAVLLRSGGAAP
jgi:uncharacterized protein YfeS